MTEFERKKIDLELKMFTARHFVKPADCRNIDEVRFYVQELSYKIDNLKRDFNYVPDWAYYLLAQYNARHDGMLHIEFRNTYH